MGQPDDMLDDEDYPAYTMGRAAEIIGRTPDFLRWLGDAKLIDPFRSGGGHRRYSRYQIRLAARAREMSPVLNPAPTMRSRPSPGQGPFVVTCRPVCPAAPASLAGRIGWRGSRLSAGPRAGGWGSRIGRSRVRSWLPGRSAPCRGDRLRWRRW